MTRVKCEQIDPIETHVRILQDKITEEGRSQLSFLKNQKRGSITYNTWDVTGTYVYMFHRNIVKLA